VDIINKESRDHGYKLINRFISTDEIRIVIVGGDGTISSILEEASLNSVDIEKIPIAIFPFGTGNDLS
jgi:diacylglycerol kinase family enzyme